MAKTLQGYVGPVFPSTHPSAGQMWSILTGEGAFTGTADAGGQQHTLRFCIPWEGLANFQLYVLLYTSIVQATAAGGAASISRNVPMQSPYNGFFPNTYATSLRFAGGNQDDLVTDSRLYGDMLLDVTFGTLPFDPGDGSGPYLTVTGSGSANYATVSNAKLAFDDGEAIDHDYGILIGQEELRFEFAQIPDLGYALGICMPLKGTVNSLPVTLDGYAYPAGCLLYNTHDYQHTVNALGAQTASMSLSVTQRDIPWNSGIASDGAAHAITPASYVLADHNALLSIG